MEVRGHRVSTRQNARLRRSVELLHRLATLVRRSLELEPTCYAILTGVTAGVGLGLKLRLDRGLTLHRAPLPGHAGAYRASWHEHGHLDTFRVYGGPTTAAQRLNLRALGRFVGLGDARSRPSPTQTLSNEALHACAPSDARLARVLAERRWPAAARCVDRVERDEAELVAVAAKRLARRTPVTNILVEQPPSWAH